MRIAGGAIAASHDLGIALREHLGLLVGTYLLAARIEGERVSGCGGGGVADDDAAVRGLIGAHALVAVVVLAAIGVVAMVATALLLGVCCVRHLRGGRKAPLARLDSARSTTTSIEIGKVRGSLGPGSAAMGQMADA